CVHALPSLQGAVLLVWRQPTEGSQKSSVQGLPSSQFGAAPPVHAPALQTSPVVQALPSLQVVPLALVGLEQVPVVGSQVPALWLWSRALQRRGLAPPQVPGWQASLCVQALPSVQVVPLGLFGLAQTPVVVSQVPAEWH